MNIEKITSLFFSPTDSTKEILSRITEKLPLQAEVMDITGYRERNRSHEFGAGEAVFIGIPVYGGRVPAPAVETLRNMKGNHTPVVLLATYGNREYEDALLELQNLMEENGFIVTAAAAFITEHSIMHSVAKGRPDAEDKKIIDQFAAKVWEKLQKADIVSGCAGIAVKGNVPYREYKGVPLKPQGTKKCTKCGICAASCPVQAISPETPENTDKNRCISCMRCMKVCPVQARKLNKMMLAVAEKSFYNSYSARKEPEIFL